MGVFGDRMRREREMRGVTLEEISESTKISKRSLQALEEEDFDLLPGGIFNKGFVRAYARFLGIDEEQAVADFAAADNEQPATEDVFPLKLHDRQEQPPLNPKRSLLPVLLALLVLVAVAGAWTFWTKHRPPRTTNESQGSETSLPAAQVPEQPRSESAAPPTANTNEAGSAASKSTEKPNSTEPDQKTPFATSPTTNGTPDAPSEPSATRPPALTDSTGKQSSPAESAGVKDPSSSDSAPLSKQAFTISVKATEDSWISIVADGKPKVEGILSAEKQRSVTAGKELVLVTGNAGGIEVSYNGKPIASLGKKQQRRRVTFTAQGMRQ
jgi:cytoskeleton protein RodZ